MSVDLWYQMRLDTSLKVVRLPLSLFFLSYGNSIWLPRWPLSRPMGHELAWGTKKLVKFNTSGFQKCELKNVS